MCLVLLVILTVIVALCDNFYSDLSEVIEILSGFLAGADLIVIIVLIFIVASGSTIDERLAMYTEENANIEASIDEVVTQYMEYESNTFKELKTDSPITLVSLYPELKSDELIKTQIETYQSNNDTIRSLKEEKINLRVAKWWLYFGK